MGLSPQQIRDIQLDDFLNMMHAFGGDKDAAVTDEQYADMVARWEAGELG